MSSAADRTAEQARRRVQRRTYTTGVGVPGQRNPWGDTSLEAWQVDRKTASISIRRAAYQSTVLQSYLQRLRTQVIGDCGIQPDFTCVQKTSSQKMIESLWRDYCEAADVTGRISMVELQQSLVESLALDGRVFAVLRRHTDYPQGLAIMPLGREWLADEQGNIRTTKEPEKKEGPLVSQGVGYAKSGRIVDYRFYSDFSPATIAQLSLLIPVAPAYVTGEVRIVPAADVYDIRRQRSVGDWDGAISWLLPAVAVLRRVAELDDAAMSALVSATQLMGFITRDETSPEAPGREPAVNFPAPVEFERNRIETLLRGENFQGFNPGQPNMDQLKARKEYLRSLSTALGFDYASLNSDAEAVNFSSIRHFENLNRDYCRDAVRVFVDRWMQPFVRDWIDWVSTMGILPKVSRESLMQARMCEFTSRRWAYVDPAKDAVMQKTLAALMAKSPQMIAREMGVNFDRVVEDWQSLVKQLGLDSMQDLLQVFALLTGRSAAMTAPMKGSEPGMESPDPGDEEKPDEEKPDEEMG